MKNAPDHFTAIESAQNSAKFTGTDNPRHLRAIAALLKRPISRQELDSVAGAANSPELIAELRRRGLPIQCERITFIDRDGKKCHPGVYHFTNACRKAFWAWKRQGGAA